MELLGVRQNSLRITLKIGVYTIALNEEQFVERWYNSAKEADYILIADTGSTDSTIQKAKNLGVNVINISISPWRFDDARNAALAALPSDLDFCIALDMDEVLVSGWRTELEKTNSRTTRPRYNYTWSWNDVEETIPGLVYGGDKIHKRHGYRWRHPVHEVITADRIEEVQEWLALEIHHHPDHTKGRGQYFPLLELSTKEDPTDDRNAFYLAREYFFYNRLEEASAEFKRHLSLPKAVWAPERAASYRYLAKCEPDNAYEYLQKAISTAPGRREALVELALWAYSKENWKECYAQAKSAIAIEEKPLDYLCEAFAWGSQPWDLAALSAYHLGKYKEAVKYGKKAWELEPRDARLASNLMFYQAK